MISDALDYIRREIRDYLGIADNQASVGHLHNLTDSGNNPGVRIALVNVTEETTLRNTPHRSAVLQGSSNTWSRPYS